MSPGSLKTVKLEVKCSEASSGSEAQAALKDTLPSHPSLLGQSHRTFRARLVVPPFRCLTLIMQSDGSAGLLLTLNPRFRCAGTSGIQLQLDDKREPERNLYKYGVEARRIPSHQAVEFQAENDPNRMEAAFLCTHIKQETWSL